MESFLRPYVILLLMASLFLLNTDAIAVMSVDLGSEQLKVAIVSPGVPMEIALNKESKRKTPVTISFRDGEREFGDAALAISTRFPEKSYRYILDLVGKSIDNPIVKLFQQRFPFYKIVADERRKTVIFEQDEELRLTPEELLAIVLSKARDQAQDFAGQPIKDMVVTVPAFFNQAERRAVLEAAELAGLKVLQLMSDNAAVALNYGIFRRKDFNTTLQRIMFFDMGASSTIATIVGYQLVKSKEKGIKETNPQVSVLGVGYDRTLGGLEITLRIRDLLANKFNEQKLTPNDITKSPRAMAKLLKESERVKMVLSANADHVAQVEGLFDDKDFKQPITRAELEALCEDIFARVAGPVESALRNAAMQMDDIDQVILVGAGTRVPRIQEELLRVVKKPELGKNLNTDEAAALGAVYQAAYLSQGFKVKRFIVKEAVLFPIQVSFERELETEEGQGVKSVLKTLFGPLNLYPQKKVMTFNRHFNDFSLSVNYGDIDFPTPTEKAAFGSLNISQIKLTGVQTALHKHSDDGSETKGVKAHFRMDESGILRLDQVEFVFEKKTLEEVADPNSDESFESTLSKLGNTISKLFTGSSEKEVGKEAQDDKEGEMPTPDEDASKLNVSEEVGNVTDSNAAAANITQDSADKDSENKTIPKKVESKVLILKEPIGVEESRLDLDEMDAAYTKESRDKLRKFDRQEQDRNEREESRNSLEAFILETQDKLYQQEYEDATTEKEREEIQAKLTAASDWLDGIDSSEAIDAKDYREKLSSLRSQTRELFDRVREHRERPEALKALSEIMNISEIFFRQAKNLSDDDQYFTEVELNTLEKAISDVKEWRGKREEEQSKLLASEKPVLTVRAIAEKIAILDREVKYLVNKAKNAKPKPKKVENTTVNEELDKDSSTSPNTTDSTADDGDVTTAEEEEGDQIEDKTTETSDEHEMGTKPLELGHTEL